MTLKSILPLKRIGEFLLFIVLFCSNTLAQVNNTELPDPKPGSQEGWQQLTTPVFGWGRIDVRYSRSEVPDISMKSPLLRAWRGERVSAQAILATPKELEEVSISVSDLKSGKHTIPASAIKRYFVRYVLSEPFYNKKDSMIVADRLDPVEKLKVEANTVRPIWLDIHVPADAAPGTYQGTLTLRTSAPLQLPIVLQVAD